MNNGSTITFGIAYKNNVRVLVTPLGEGANPGCHVQNISNTSFKAYNGSSWSMYWIVIGT